MWLSKAENVTVTLIAETVALISYFAIYNWWNNTHLTTWDYLVIGN